MGWKAFIYLISVKICVRVMKGSFSAEKKKIILLDTWGKSAFICLCRAHRIDPLYHSKGLGSVLLQHALAVCDRDNKFAYLESSISRNITLYERHGFKLPGTIQVNKSPTIYPMLRKPHKLWDGAALVTFSYDYISNEWPIFCHSIKVFSSYNKGVPYSQETKERIRQSALKAGVGRWNRGRAMTWGDKITESIRRDREKKQLGDKGSSINR